MSPETRAALLRAQQECRKDVENGRRRARVKVDTRPEPVVKEEAPSWSDDFVGGCEDFT